MDYSKFVDAVKTNDKAALDTLVRKISAVLKSFLIVRLGVGPEDAEDCTQNTLLLAVEKIREDKLNNPDSIIFYLFTTAKNDYLKLLASRKDGRHESLQGDLSEEPAQLNKLLSKEKKKFLKQCVESLKEDYKNYIQYWLENPDKEAIDVANKFGISVNNAWTKKHRIIQVLKDCIEKKINL